MIRQRICEVLGYLGSVLDESNSARNEYVILVQTGAVIVRMIRVDEEAMIAQATQRNLDDPDWQKQ